MQMNKWNIGMDAHATAQEQWRIMLEFSTADVNPTKTNKLD